MTRFFDRAFADSRAVRLVDEDGDPVGVDEIGTLELHCGSLFAGYWGGNAETDLRADGWFTTRDRFMIDREGFYHHCGRVDDLFKVGGIFVAPREVEDCLLAHPAVSVAAGICLFATRRARSVGSR